MTRLAHRLGVVAILAAFAASGGGRSEAAQPETPPALERMRQVDVVEAVGPDDYKVRLMIDAVTNLPAALEWEGRGARISISSDAGVKRDGESTHKRVQVFGDFRPQDGVTWPRTIKELIGAVVYDDGLVTKIALNPTLDEKVFQTGK